MTTPLPVTSENLQEANDGYTAPSQQAPASETGSTRPWRGKSNRPPVQFGGFRGGDRDAGIPMREGDAPGRSDFQYYGDPQRAPGDSQGGPAGSEGTDEQHPVQGTGPSRETPAPVFQPRVSRESTGGHRASASNSGFPTQESLSAAQQLLLDELVEINGQDSYDALSAGIGKLKQDEYLRLPLTYAATVVQAKDVGKPIAHSGMTPAVWAQVYALNKVQSPDGADPVTFGFLRMEAVKAGWFDNQREVMLVAEVPGALRIMVEDYGTIRDKLERIKTAAFIVPLVAEHVFRTMGHHYITSDSASYVARYSDTFRSCLLPDIAGILPPAVLYHAALHWVSPRRSRAVLMAQAGTPAIPDALTIRANAAPAGTAILTTTAAIIDSMMAVGIASEFATHGHFNLPLITKLTEVIKNDPTRYHKSYFAYGVTPLTTAESKQLEAGKAEAVRFAPYAQAFVNVLLKDAALGRAKALKKHADGNPVQMRRAANFFRALTRKEVTSITKLFDASIASQDLD